MNRGGFIVGAVALTLVGSLLYVKGRLLVVEFSYALSQKQSQRVKLEQARQSLLVERATLRSPERIEKIARTKLGLRQPLSGVSMVIVHEDLRP